MSPKDALLAEWDQEMAGTRKTLASIPDGQHEWAPHAKSMKLGKLGAHLASMGMWAQLACETDVYDAAKLTLNWTLRAGPREIFSRPRAVVLRSFVMNHMIHHRAQLTVYLRLLDVKVPGLYGPTADD